MDNKIIARKAFGVLIEDVPPAILWGIAWPGRYSVLIDQHYAGSFRASTREIAIKQFEAGLYTRFGDSVLKYKLTDNNWKA